MAFMLDTSVAIHVRDGDPVVLAKLGTLNDAVTLSVVTRVELEGGVHRFPEQAAARRLRLEAMLRRMPVVAFDDAAADAYSIIVQAAGYSRRKILERIRLRPNHTRPRGRSWRSRLE